MRLDELSLVARLERRTTKDSSSGRKFVCVCKDGHQTKNVKKSQQGSRWSRVRFHASGLLLGKVFNFGQNKLKRVSRHPQPFLERGFVPVLVSVRPPISVS